MENHGTTRRDFLRHGFIGALGIAGGTGFSLPEREGAQEKLTPEQALARLKAGNADMLAGRLRKLPENPARRLEIARKQAPFAVLVGCSDSRVPPELLFGAGLGELRLPDRFAVDGQRDLVDRFHGDPIAHVSLAVQQ